MFDVFTNRYIIRGTIRTATAVHIGGSSREFKPGDVDNTMIKDINGNPFIPGSSLKGVLRSFLERVLRVKGIGVCTLTKACMEDEAKKERAEELKNQDEDLAKYVYESICPVCSIFGSNENSSKIVFRDARALEFSGYEIRTGVTIDRDTNTAADKRLYEVEVVPADTVFDFRAAAENVNDKEWDYILLLLKAMQDGFIEIGGLTSRGLGGIALEDVRIEKIQPENLLAVLLCGQRNEISLQDEIERLLEKEGGCIV